MTGWFVDTERQHSRSGAILLHIPRHSFPLRDCFLAVHAETEGLVEKSKHDGNVGGPSWPKAPGVTEGEESLLFEYRSLLDKVKGAESREDFVLW